MCARCTFISTVDPAAFPSLGALGREMENLMTVHTAELAMHGVAEIAVTRRLVLAEGASEAFETVRLVLKDADGEVIASVLAYADRIGLPITGDVAAHRVA